MKIGGNLSGFDISAKGLSIQRKKMNLIAENIANADTVRTQDGQPYQRKSLEVTQKQDIFLSKLSAGNQTLKLNVTNENHISAPVQSTEINGNEQELNFNEIKDTKEGDIVYMPDHPDANEEGYVQMSNVNIITEMVDMIAASRSYEANLTALNASKQIAKDSLEI
jgi:flagellar basal-body rod protein FlgC